MRVLNDWLDAYMEFTEESEPPILYREWVGMFTIAAALRRKVYLPQGLRSPIYPNLYVIFVGAPGRCRKGTAMAVGKDLMETVGIKIAPPSITIEALIKLIEESEELHTDADGKHIVHSSLSVFSEELMVFLDYNNGKFLSALTDLYDCAEHWEYRTKNMGTNEITGVWLNLLGATTPHLIQVALPPDSIGGGLASRMIFVYEDDKAKTLKMKMHLTPREEKLRADLVHDLAEIGLLSGRFKFTPEAEEWFTDWYLNMKSTMAPMPRDFEGYVNRRPTHLQKAAMILCASRGSSRTVEVSDLERALHLHERTEKKMPRTFAGTGASKVAPIMDRVKQHVARRKTIKLKELHSTFANDFDSTQDFVTAVDTLKDQGFLTYEKNGQGKISVKYLASNYQHEMYKNV